jgi:hypothetical protein
MQLKQLTNKQYHSAGTNLLLMLLFMSMGMRLCLWTAASSWPIVHPTDDIWVWRATVKLYRQGKTEERREILSQCYYAHHKYHMDTGANPGLCGERTAPNSLSHATTYAYGTAMVCHLHHLYSANLQYQKIPLSWRVANQAGLSPFFCLLSALKSRQWVSHPRKQEVTRNSQ